MKLITKFELVSKPTHELHGLYREMFNALARSELHTLERANVLASLENIQREIASRLSP